MSVSLYSVFVLFKYEDDETIIYSRVYCLLLLNKQSFTGDSVSVFLIKVIIVSAAVLLLLLFK